MTYTKYYIPLPLSIFLLFMTYSFGAITQNLQMDVDGALKIYHEGETTPDPGTIRWSACDYEVWNGSQWVSITTGSGISRYAKSEGGSLADLGRSVASDINGNIYLTGYFTGTAYFVSEEIIGNGSQDIFLAKYDKHGSLQWVVSAGGPLVDIGYCVTTDGHGNIYLTGLFEGTAQFENTEITSAGESDIFLAKYNNAGDLIWVNQAGGLSSDRAYAISSKNPGEIYLTGSFQDTAFFGTDTLISNEFIDMFLAKYDANGNHLWLKKAGGSSADTGFGLSEDDNQNIYVTGYYRGAATFDNEMVSGNNSNNIFLAKYNSFGSLIWVKTAGGSGNDVGSAVVVDNNNIFLTGFFSNTATFETITMTSRGGVDAFTAKYTDSGTLVWVKQAGNSDSDAGEGIDVDQFGNIYVTGSFKDSFEIESNKLFSRGDRDIFIIKYSNSGSLIWLKHIGDNLNENVFSVAIDSNDKIYITGSYQSQTMIGLTNLQSNGFSDIFLAKFDP